LQDYLATTGLDKERPCAPLVGRYYKQHLLTAMVGFTPSRQTDLLRNFTLIQSLEKFHRFLGNSF
jgi:hypothetical protein